MGNLSDKTSLKYEYTGNSKKHNSKWALIKGRCGATLLFEVVLLFSQSARLKTLLVCDDSERMAGKHLSLLLALGSLAVGSAQSNQGCRCFPGDECWPSANVWYQFNQTVDGRLIATTPLATPCHAPNYDAAICDKLRDQWTDPELQYATPPYPSICEKEREREITQNVAILLRRQLCNRFSPMAPVTLSMRRRSRVLWVPWSTMR